MDNKKSTLPKADYEKLLGITGLALLATLSSRTGIAEGLKEKEYSFQHTEDHIIAAQNDAEEAMRLKPNLENGRRLYIICAVCHEPEGWGRTDGYYPQIAGQLRVVQIKQLADIRIGNRDNPTMFPFALTEILPTAQDISDVSDYVARLPMSRTNGIGSGNDLEHGEKVYRENCVECHGENGEGVEEKHGPLIQGQHYAYLVRQFEWIRDGKRRNADPEMVKQIKGFTTRDIQAQMDYVSRMPPPPEKIAPVDWQNPDFPNYWRESSQ